MLNLIDARSISRIASNLCQRQAGMLLLDLPESDVYALLTGTPYPGPRGERTAALRWGRLFEAKLTENHARRLVACLDGVIGFQAATATVTDLREVAGTTPDAVVERTRRTRAFLADLLAHRPVPDLLLQPPLVLSWGGQDWGVIVPDGLVLDRTQGGYLPLETKGFVSQEGVVTPGERSAMRRQAAVELWALRSELARLDPASTVPSRALCVVATPFGFHPAPAVLEELEAEVVAVEGALRTLSRVISHLALRRQSTPLKETLLGLPIHYVESCVTSCALAQHCRHHAPGVRAALGDQAAQLLGEDLDLARITALVSGDRAATLEEAALQAALDETTTLFGWKAP